MSLLLLAVGHFQQCCLHLLLLALVCSFWLSPSSSDAAAAAVCMIDARERKYILYTHEWASLLTYTRPRSGYIIRAGVSRVRYICASSCPCRGLYYTDTAVAILYPTFCMYYSVDIHAGERRRMTTGGMCVFYRRHNTTLDTSRAWWEIYEPIWLMDGAEGYSLRGLLYDLFFFLWKRIGTAFDFFLHYTYLYPIELRYIGPNMRFW